MTFDPLLLLRDGLLLSVLASAFVIAIMRVNPRLFLRYYPKAIREAAAPISREERAISRVLAVPFLGLLIGLPLWSTMTFVQHHPTANDLSAAAHGFGVSMCFNVVDLLAIDFLWFGRFRPAWATIPGAERIAFVFNASDHLRGFAVGTLLSALAGSVAALVASH